ncbi:MAG: heparinase II/III family protein [Alphaproteobacteria bacterium]|nr:heparinase II/III family protein [Alphaproteobacteria bacterium]
MTNGISNSVYRSRLYKLALKGRGPTTLIALPPDYAVRGVTPGDPERGRAVLDGRYRILGREMALGTIPWQGQDLDAADRTALHCFDWFGDLAALDADVARRHAAVLLEDWDDRFGTYVPMIWDAEALSARLINWLCHYEALFRRAEPTFRLRFLDCVARQLRHLRRIADTAGDSRFAALTALIYAEVCVADEPERLERGMSQLAVALEHQVLSDGSHPSRSPARQLAVFERLVDLRDLLTTANREVPTALRNAIDRMAPMLRYLRLGDGALTSFNGGARTDAARVAKVLERSDAAGRPPQRAPYARFERIEMKDLVVVLDGGGAPGDGFDRDAHAGTLSFEMSAGAQPLFVNCGAAPDDEPGWQRALRTTAAHTVLAVGDTNCCGLRDHGDGGGFDRPIGTVECDRGEIDGNVWISSSHDGYLDKFGLTYRRRLYVDQNGSDLRGEDILVGEQAHDFALRFHLHPKVTATLGDDARTIALDLPGESTWRFRIGIPLTLEDSVYWSPADGPQPTRQIVAAGRTEGAITTVKWALQRGE